MQPNILECVSDITYKCVYTFDSVSEHSFSVPLLNGVIAGEYELMMKVVDMNSGQTVYEQSADNGPFNLDPHARDFANWSTPYSGWYDGHEYEDVLGGGIGVPQTDCEDLDIWLLRTPPYNTGVGYSNGHYDNMTVLEYDCTLGTYPNPLDATASGVHNFKLDAEHNYPSLDLSTVEPALAGPKRPQDRVDLSAMNDSTE